MSQAAESSLPLHPRDVGSGRYRLGPFIGSGGMGEVYMAWDREKRGPVALKFVKGEATGFETAHRTFSTEFHILKDLRHPNVVSVYDIGTHQDQSGLRTFFTMELIFGTDIVSHGWRSFEEAVVLAQQMLGAIGYCHNRNIWHRDLKPRNVLVGLLPETGKRPEADCVKMVDFGLAGHGQSPAKRLGATFEYLSPEEILETPLPASPGDVAERQARRLRRSDLYSAGVILYVLLTGRYPSGRPYPSSSRSLEEIKSSLLRPLAIPPVSHYRHNVPPLLENAIMRLLSSEDQRPETADEVIEELKRGFTSTTIAWDSVVSDSPKYVDTGIFQRLKLKQAEHDSGVIIITGVEGVGKSRLLEELAVDFSERNVEVVGGAYTASGGLERLPHAASLASLVRRAYDELRANPDLDDPGRQLESCLSRLIEQGLVERPQAILVDDAHWADIATAQALVRACARLCGSGSGPLLLIMTMSGAESTGASSALLAESHALSRESLEPLTPDQVRAWLDQRGRFENLETLVDYLEEETGGNPRAMDGLYMELRTSGALKQTGGIHRLNTKALARIETRRRRKGRSQWPQLQLLDDDEKRVMMLLAVADAFLPIRDLQSLCKTEAPIAQVLDRLTTKWGLVKRVKDHFRVAAAGLRDTVYGGTPASSKRDAHRDLAGLIEALHPQELDRYMEKLSYHRVRAGDTTIGATYSIRAARKLVKDNLYDRAIPRYLDAIQLKKSEPATQAELLLELSTTYLYARRAEEAEKALRAAWRIARPRRDPLLSARCAIGESALRLNRWRLARRPAEGEEQSLHRTLALSNDRLQKLGSPEGDRVRVVVLRELGDLAIFRGLHEEACAHLERAVAIARNAGESNFSALLGRLGFALAQAQQYDRAVEVTREAVEHAVREKDRVALADAHLKLGQALANNSQPVEAERHYREGYNHAKAARTEARAAGIRFSLGEVLLGLGRAQEAQGLAAEALDFYGRGAGSDALKAQLALGKALYLQGRYESAKREFEELRALSGTSDAYRLIGYHAVEHLALIATEMGDDEGRRRLAELVSKELASRASGGRVACGEMVLAHTMLSGARYDVREGLVRFVKHLPTSDCGAAATLAVERVKELGQGHFLLGGAIAACGRALHGDRSACDGAREVVEEAVGSKWKALIADVSFHCGVAAYVLKDLQGAGAFAAEAVRATAGTQMHDLSVCANTLMMLVLMDQGRHQTALRNVRDLQDHMEQALGHLSETGAQEDYLSERLRALAYHRATALQE